jgi:hypothetical protein
VRFAALALADDSRRFVPGYPPKGARLFLRPNLEISRLAGLISGTDQLVCRDQRVETLQWDGPVDLCLVHVGFGHERSAQELTAELSKTGTSHLLFGPAVTSWGDNPPAWAGARVSGDLLNAWTEIRADVEDATLRPFYRASRDPHYHPPSRGFGRWPSMHTQDQTTVFVQGCSCPSSVRRFCSQHLYYGQNRLARSKDEIVGEIMTLPGKCIRLLDDDISRRPDYYHDVFRSLWNYKRLWTVNAGDDLFSQPGLISLLAKAGTRVILLNESFLEHRLLEATRSERLVKHLYRKVKYLQSRRMLVGARATLALTPGQTDDFEQAASVLRRIDLDFVELRLILKRGDAGPRLPGTAAADTRLVRAAYEPMLDPSRPAWIVQRFYSIGRILNRMARRPRRAGFYTTARFLLPYSMAYRQDFLEGVASV